MVYAFNPSTWETEAGGSLYFQDQPGLQSEIQESKGTQKNLVSKEKKSRKNENPVKMENIQRIWILYDIVLSLNCLTAEEGATTTKHIWL